MSIRQIRFAALVALYASLSAESLFAQTPARWTAAENLRIGSVNDPAALLSGPGPIAVGPRGTVYVVESQEGLVRVFDGAGKPLPSIGRRGQGPGEFQRIGWIGFLSDTLYVTDASTGRVNLFTGDGKLLSTLTMSAPSIGAGYSAAPAGRLFPGGTGLAAPGIPSRAIADGEITRIPYIRVARDGRVTDTVVWTAVGNRQLAIRRGTGGFYTRQLFADNALVDFAPDTSGGAIVERGAATAASAAQFRIIRFNLRGDTVSSRAYSYTPAPLATRYSDSLVKAMAAVLAQGPGSQPVFPSATAAEEALRAAMYIPKFKIPVAAVHYSEDGTLWLRRDAGDENVQRWEVYNTRGDPVASLTLPLRIQVRLIQRDAIWGVEANDDGVPFLVRFRIAR